MLLHCNIALGWQRPRRTIAPLQERAGARSRGLPVERESAQQSNSSLPALTLGAIGVVYGDIGTSPLYAFKEVFAHGHVPLSAENIYGVLSLMFWTLTVVVSLKYVLLILRADNNGEGGLIAMLALASRAVADKPALRARTAPAGHLRHGHLLR